MHHKYSIDEIDAMREALAEIICNRRPMLGPQRMDLYSKVELELRTHMMNGTTVEELQKKAKHVIAACLARAELGKDDPP